MSEPAITIRPLTLDDLPAALAIQQVAYPAFLVEPAEAFASRLTLPASYCLAAERDDTLIAYLLAHGWQDSAPPLVGAVLTTEGTAEVLFLHDLAVSQAARGSGIGRRLVEQALAMAARDGLPRAQLIAVEGAAPYWRALGFAEGAMSQALADKVRGYGASARWMERGLG
ncbi:GNAT family N-acetyltransferase [Novosphingobium sp. 9]|uniref:GNAT family N-acetyltransferase n=1 Tax=Novosphingobium sp. 9 TaxID=2025349 RepID=UPI0021B6B8C1|nr:GNAT family N-acetyltransferase [Novosphingobium sp. 9]